MTATSVADRSRADAIARETWPPQFGRIRLQLTDSWRWIHAPSSLPGQKVIQLAGPFTKCNVHTNPNACPKGRVFT
eukprot:6705540-Pyramimonas_sp.AAC.1